VLCQVVGSAVVPLIHGYRSGRPDGREHRRRSAGHRVRSAGVESYVDDAVGKGATVRPGGERPDGPGWFYPPTVLTGVTPKMRMCREEVFGPVAQVWTVPSSGRIGFAAPTPTPLCALDQGVARNSS